MHVSKRETLHFQLIFIVFDPYFFFLGEQPSNSILLHFLLLLLVIWIVNVKRILERLVGLQWFSLVDRLPCHLLQTYLGVRAV